MELFLEVEAEDRRYRCVKTKKRREFINPNKGGKKEKKIGEMEDTEMTREETESNELHRFAAGGLEVKTGVGQLKVIK